MTDPMETDPMEHVIVDIADRFEDYDDEHPDTWKRFKQIALDILVENPKAKFGGGLIAGVLRWQNLRRNLPNKTHGVNSTMTSQYARKLKTLTPELFEAVQLRPTHS